MRGLSLGCQPVSLRQRQGWEAAAARSEALWIRAGQLRQRRSVQQTWAHLDRPPAAPPFDATHAGKSPISESGYWVFHGALVSIHGPAAVLNSTSDVILAGVDATTPVPRGTYDLQARCCCC